MNVDAMPRLRVLLVLGLEIEVRASQRAAGSFPTHPVAATIAAGGVILAAIYLLWLVQKAFFGPITSEENRNIPEIAWNEVAALVPLVILMVWIGVHPNTFLKKMEASVKPDGDDSEGRRKTFSLRVPSCELRATSREKALATRNSQRHGGEPMNLQPLVGARLPPDHRSELVLCAGGMLLILYDACVPRAKSYSSLQRGTTTSSRAPASSSAARTRSAPITKLFDLTLFLASMFRSSSRATISIAKTSKEEFYALIAWGTVCITTMGKGLDLLIVILGLKILSVCIFVLVGYHRRLSVSNEANLKYFLVGQLPQASSSTARRSSTAPPPPGTSPRWNAGSRRTK